MALGGILAVAAAAGRHWDKTFVRPFISQSDYQARGDEVLVSGRAATRLAVGHYDRSLRRLRLYKFDRILPAGPQGC